jgi:OOP family OmpA-OmpF porin
MLDDLVCTLQGAKLGVILAIGHTDRKGTKAYNQKLSERRAAAVKNYLVGKGIAPNRIHADGKGESKPATKPAGCRGKRGKALIACPQPDRRVDA